MEGLFGRHNKKKRGPYVSGLLASPISSHIPESLNTMPYSVAHSYSLPSTLYRKLNSRATDNRSLEENLFSSKEFFSQV